jgi:hypothetical protein
MTLFSGWKYRGSYVNNLKHGYGELIYTNGTIDPDKKWEKGVLIKAKNFEFNEEWSNFLLSSILMSTYKTNSIVDRAPIDKYLDEETKEDKDY